LILQPDFCYANATWEDFLVRLCQMFPKPNNQEMQFLNLDYWHQDMIPLIYSYLDFRDLYILKQATKVKLSFRSECLLENWMKKYSENEDRKRKMKRNEEAYWKKLKSSGTIS
jgi:hypothetical protein